MIENDPLNDIDISDEDMEELDLDQEDLDDLEEFLMEDAEEEAPVEDQIGRHKQLLAPDPSGNGVSGMYGGGAVGRHKQIGAPNQGESAYLFVLRQ